MALKKLIKNILPRQVVLEIQKRRYAHVFREMTLDFDPELGALRKLVYPGEAVLDVGANMGGYTVIFSRLVGGHGSVVSIGPAK